LILIQPYTTAVDIWSLGCIFAELLSMQEGNVPGYQDRKPLFPGGACYPLSGDADNAERLDQLNVIFGVIGTPSKEDIEAIGKANEYIKKMKATEPKRLQDLFPAADPEAIDLLYKMLKFNPKQRCTANEALEHGFFSGIRRRDMEKAIDTALVSPEFLHQKEIDIDTLKRMTYEEVLWFRDHPDPPRPTAPATGAAVNQAEGPAVASQQS
jgi:mitogen-activated protein kinase 1/3